MAYNTPFKFIMFLASLYVCVGGNFGGFIQHLHSRVQCVVGRRRRT